jgi:hypothetical protein
LVLSFFKRTLIIRAYLEILRTSIVPAIRELNGNEEFCFQQNGALDANTEISVATTVKGVQVGAQGEEERFESSLFSF